MEETFHFLALVPFAALALGLPSGLPRTLLQAFLVGVQITAMAAYFTWPT